MPRRPSMAQENRSRELVWVRSASSVSLPATTSGSLINFSSALNTAIGETARNWTIERILGNFTLTVPASTAAGRSYHAFTAIDVVDDEISNLPEPFSDNRSFPWVDGRRVFADHTVPVSYAAPGINGTFVLDMRSKRKGHGLGRSLKMFGYHDDGLGANPVMYYAYSALFRVPS